MTSLVPADCTQETASDLGHAPGAHGPECTGIVIPGVYDGIAVWQCPDGLHNRFADVNERRVANGGEPWFSARAVDAADAWIAANS